MCISVFELEILFRSDMHTYMQWFGNPVKLFSQENRLEE